ncbi:MAG: enoyl-CoA hydratase/isomerase family protein [Henriciella sp.]|nr:enoyl-CoA hydratase/isomerase family protein [Henriciella sp.]
MTLNICFREEGRLGRIALNRKASQHRLDLAMCQEMIRILRHWQNDDAIELVVLEHIEGSRGFCSGSDLIMLADMANSPFGGAERYFSSLYNLCSLIAQYPKPIVTLMDGVVKSSGIGLAVNGAYRVATERTVLSYPDTACGIVPDAGATLFLSKLPNEIGTWLALTGERLTGPAAAASGLATHYCGSDDIKSLKRALQNDGISALDLYRVDAEPEAIEHYDEIGALFRSNCATELAYGLQSSGAWAKKQATKILAKSPLSTKIALRQIRTGQYLESVSEALKIEYRLTTRLAKTRNLREGVRATLVEMDFCPDWHPGSLRSVTYDHVAKFFTPYGIEDLELDPVGSIEHRERERIAS